MSYTIEDVDRYLRNNMDDVDYELYSEAIDRLIAENIELKEQNKDLIKTNVICQKDYGELLKDYGNLERELNYIEDQYHYYGRE